MEVRLIGYDKVQRMLKKLGSDVSTRQLMAEIGQFVQTSIKHRTQKQGVDVYYDSFDDYSVGHRKRREEKGLPVDTVDLTFTGSMFASMTQEEFEEQVNIFFTPTQDRTGMSNPEKAYYLNEGREFFGISDFEEEKLVNMALDHIDDLLRGV